MTQMPGRVDVAHTHEASARDEIGTPTLYEPCFLLASGVSAQSYALLAVPSHAQSAPPVEAESSGTERNAKTSDPTTEPGWLAAAGAFLMGGLLGDW
jgi:hypothetical protein